MSRKIFPRAALAWALALPLAALAADPGELAALRDELRQLRESYTQRIGELEKRLAEVAPPPVARRLESVPSGTPGGGGDGNAFNPEISLILQGGYRSGKNLDEREITGFAAPASHDHEKGGGPRRGFSLDASELTLAANIDPRFRGSTNLALHDGEVEVEEAWLQTLGLGRGLTLKAGRFLSGVGYANERHPHQWDFAGPSLMHEALFGEHGSYANDGLQLRWVAPTELFLGLGVEVGRGASFPGNDRNVNGVGATALFAHLGGDLGASHSWQAGLSWLGTKAKGRESHYTDTLAAESVVGAFSGDSRIWIADLVWKWAPEGNARQTSLLFQAEYFQRRESGTLSCFEEGGSGASACAVPVDSLYRSRQSGWYAQTVYQFHPEWRVGARYDRLDGGRLDFGANNANLEGSDHRPEGRTVMVDWRSSEFARLRLQFAQDRARQGLTDKQWWLQYIVSLGAHGAHAF